VYNSYGQLVEESAADYDNIEYIYDRNGNLLFKKDGNQRAKDGEYGDTTKSFYQYFKYDRLNRKIESGVMAAMELGSSWKDTIYTHYDKYEYDLDTNLNSKGRLALEWETQGNVRYAQMYNYDARGRISRQTNRYIELILYWGIRKCYARSMLIRTLRMKKR
jgi:hypothetical protein